MINKKKDTLANRLVKNLFVKPKSYQYIIINWHMQTPADNVPFLSVGRFR